MLVTLIGIVTGYLTANSIDVSSLSATNDLVGAVLRSDVVSSALSRAQVTAGLLIMGAGICFGVIMFGLGVIFDRLKQSGNVANG